jgi:hypothetical protein
MQHKSREDTRERSEERRSEERRSEKERRRSEERRSEEERRRSEEEKQRGESRLPFMVLLFLEFCLCIFQLLHIEYMSGVERKERWRERRDEEVKYPRIEIEREERRGEKREKREEREERKDREEREKERREEEKRGEEREERALHKKQQQLCDSGEETILESFASPVSHTN